MIRPLRAAAWGLAVLLLALILYLLAALLLGVWPRNAEFVETPGGVPVYVRTNGIHAELILPTRADAVDWSSEFPAVHMRALAAPTPWIAFGWGDRGFMLTTPTWSDLRPATALIALIGLGKGAMHVEYIEAPSAYHARRVTVSADQYQRLVRFVRGSFVRDPGGRVRKIDAPGYFKTDAFYEAVPVYTFWYTCNEWTRRALQTAGVQTAAWAPFDVAVMAHLPAADR